MDGLFTAILDFLKQVVDRSGMKSIVALAFGGGIVYLAYTDKVDGLYALIAMTVICLAFFYMRHLEKLNEVKK
jgi:amino acid permease